MDLLKRLLIFVGSYVLASLVCLTIIGVLAGARAAINAPDMSKVASYGITVGLTFVYRYEVLVRLIALVIAGAIAFRTAGAVFTGLLAVFLYFYFDISIPIDPAAPRLASASPAKQKEEILAGQRKTLVNPLVIENPYGQAQFAAGTSVEVVSVKGDTVRVKVPGGQEKVVSRDSLK